MSATTATTMNPINHSMTCVPPNWRVVRYVGDTRAGTPPTSPIRPSPRGLRPTEQESRSVLGAPAAQSSPTPGNVLGRQRRKTDEQDHQQLEDVRRLQQGRT